ncbi:MAG TPA: ABC transporter permease [Bryobacteraceae bacterium]|nr:ABC transporter permease [Bryobacteraceae bacterium]
MRWLRPLFRRSAVEREMDAELRFHYEQIVENLRARGLDPAEARRRARLEFGGLEQVKDDAREARRADRWERIRRSLALAVRNLARSPGFSATALLTLALGIGINTLMFSMLDQLLLRNLPVRDPERLVVFHGNFITPGMYRNNSRKLSFSWPKYMDFRDHCPVFSGVAARFVTPGSLEDHGVAENVEVELVSGNYFEVLGVRPAIGRLFTPADGRTPMGDPIVVLGYSYWQRRFAGDPSIVGRQVRVNGMPMTVVGVSAPGFHSLDRGSDEDLRIPMAMKDLFTPGWRGTNAQWTRERFWAWLDIVARVKTGMPPRQAEAGANVYYHQVLRQEAGMLSDFPHRKEFLNDHLDLLPAAGGLMDQMGDEKAFFWELMAIAGVVLLIACVNLAGLLIARTAARQRELAIRLALGAGRLGVVRQLVTENLLLAAAGGAAGVLLAAALAAPAARFLADAGDLIDTPLDWRVLLFSLAVTAATALAFAIVPALQIRKAGLADVLKTESGASASRGQVRLRKAMVAAQLAFCAWLMIAAGLFARSLAQLKSVDLGFRRDHLITFQIDAAQSGYKPDAAVASYRRLTAALAALPGVTAVANSDYGVLTGNVNLMMLDIEGYRPPPPDRYAIVRELVVSPAYFRALGMEIQAGRDFTRADLRQSARVAIVNQEFVKEYFGGQNPVGRHFGWFGERQAPWEIVGVVPNQRYDGPAEGLFPFYYLPYEDGNRLSFYVRTSQPPEALTATIRRIVAQTVPGVPIDHLRTMEDLFSSTIGDKTRIAALATLFGVLATLLAAIGLYGVMAYTVTRRTREFGIRMALGAARADMQRMVLQEVAALIAAGLAIGIPTGIALARLIRSQLFRVAPMDAPAAALAAGAVAVTALLAGFLPARRATRVDPVRALRWE